MSTSWKKFALSTTAFTLLASNVFSTPYTVTSGGDTVLGGGVGVGTSGELRYVLNQLLNDRAQGNGGTTHTITFSVPSVTLTNILPMINLFTSDNITIGNASGSTTIDGGSAGRPFFIRQGDVTLQNLDIQNGKAQGGNGSGGGMGAGGALFIDQATVTLNNVNFSNNMASAGLGAGGSGGGLGGNGGSNIGGGGGYSGNGGE